MFKRWDSGFTPSGHSLRGKPAARSRGHSNNPTEMNQVLPVTAGHLGPAKPSHGVAPLTSSPPPREAHPATPAFLGAHIPNTALHAEVSTLTRSRTDLCQPQSSGIAGPQSTFTVALSCRMHLGEALTPTGVMKADVVSTSLTRFQGAERHMGGGGSRRQCGGRRPANHSMARFSARWAQGTDNRAGAPFRVMDEKGSGKADQTLLLRCGGFLPSEGEMPVTGPRA